MAVTGAGLEGIVAAESKICYIDGDAGILSYQGYNIHTLADQIRSQGIEADGHHLTNAFLGGAFSLDGVHPTNTGYAVIANQFITTLNQQRGTNIPLVNINQVASTDPLIFSDAVSAASISKHVSPAVAASMRSLFLHTPQK